MKALTPAAVLDRVAGAIPEDCRARMVVIMSLAAGYQLLSDSASPAMRTKDVDCVLEPRVEAVAAGEVIGERLLGLRWTPVAGAEWSTPGDEDTPDDELPAIRLRPPGEEGWFVELLTVPDDPTVREKQWLRVRLSTGHFGLPSFGFLPVAVWSPAVTPFGVRVARVEMMALANLLEHPSIGRGTMSGLIAGRTIKRANKDLGRVLAIAFLSSEDDIATWAASWESALRALYPDDWRDLAGRAADGLRALLASPEDLGEAHHSCQVGLLAATTATAAQLRIAGERLLIDALEPLAERAQAR